MTEHAAIYDTTTGAIRSAYKGPTGTAELQAAPSGHAVLLAETEVNVAAGIYVDLSGPSPIVAPRPAMGATISGLTISNIPVGAVLTIEGVDYTVNDGTAVLSFSAAGTYPVKLSHWPHYDQTFEVVAP